MKLGDTVEWSSQSQGKWTSKRGQIVDVIPAGVRPSRGLWPSLWNGAGPGNGRNHESYVVKVGAKFYWPVASGLKVVQP